MVHLHVYQTHFHTESIVRGLVLKERHDCKLQTCTSGLTLRLCWEDVFISKAVCKFESFALFDSGIEIVSHFCVNTLL